MLAVSPIPYRHFLPPPCTARRSFSPAVPIPTTLSFRSSRIKTPTPRFRANCADDDGTADRLSEGFSVLLLDVPWDESNIWSTFLTYVFVLHIPLSFGGLSTVAYVLHQPVLDPSTMVVSLIILQTAECFGALMLLQHSAKPQYKISSFFYEKLFSEKRSSMMATSLGIGILGGLILLTSLIADRVIGPKDVNNTILKEILLSNPASKISCCFLYCFITPLLEETVYRGFLLTSLASMMKWWQAVAISALVFSVAHFSGENSVQLFLIGCVLGSAYCWSGNLAASFSIHSAYNMFILLLTIMS